MMYRMLLVSLICLPFPIIAQEKTLPTAEEFKQIWQGKTKAEVTKAFGQPDDALKFPTDPPTTFAKYNRKALSYNSVSGCFNRLHMFCYEGDKVTKIEVRKE